MGMNLWATALGRSSSTITVSRGLRLIANIYVSLIVLMLTVIAVGPVVDNLLYGVMELPALQNNVVPMDLLYLALSWFYQLVSLAIAAIYAGLFISVIWKLDYTQSSTKTKKRKSDFF